MQVKVEAVAAAQERLEASKAALEQRREELLAKEAQLKEAALAADRAAKAAAAHEDRLKAREVTTQDAKTVSALMFSSFHNLPVLSFCCVVGSMLYPVRCWPMQLH